MLSLFFFFPLQATARGKKLGCAFHFKAPGAAGQPVNGAAGNTALPEEERQLPSGESKTPGTSPATNGRIADSPFKAGPKYTNNCGNPK